MGAPAPGASGEMCTVGVAQVAELSDRSSGTRQMEQAETAAHDSPQMPSWEQYRDPAHAKETLM